LKARSRFAMNPAIVGTRVTPPAGRSSGPRSFPISPSRDRSARDLAHCFQRLASFNNGIFERLGRYEAALWRQMLQTLVMLQSAMRR
jgi:hypothetical protein